MKHEIFRYKGWEHCVRLSNDLVELIAVTEVGPRLIRFGFVDSENVFGEMPEQGGLKGGDEWRIYGGHRLWHAPEAVPRTYYPDNQLVQYEIISGCLRLRQPVEPTTGIEKEMDIRLEEGAAQVEVIHRLKNHNLWPVSLAVWALSVMASGGVGILPMPPRQSHDENLLPANTLTLWAYTDLSDSRFRLSGRFILLRHDPEKVEPQKIGAQVPAGWTAYACNGNLFLKRFKYQPGAEYPDKGSSVEIFVNDRFAELETLGPMTLLEPGEAVEYKETWNLLRDIPLPENEADVLEHILPAITPLVE